ncbi:MAG: hypothetical protein IJ879_12095 [Muribaculaceae bacterium]|jgi:hypothetical protein|nr:hypothetical protein [Muribaculaceae bacterium]
MRRSSKLLLTLSALLLLLVAGTLDMGARVRSTRKNLRSTEVPVAVLDTVDGLLPDSLMTVDPAAVTIKGFAKRASDSKESFFITNNTRHRMSAVRLLMRYTTMNGELLTQRSVTVPVSLKPGETKLVEVKSFDVQRLFYYYAGPQPRKQATPFKVSYRLTGYDVPVGN